MIYAKKGLLCFICASVFAVIWMIILNFTDFPNYEFITFVVFVAASVSMSTVTMREYLSKGKAVHNRIIALTISTIFMFAVMAGVFFLAIIALLSQH